MGLLVRAAENGFVLLNIYSPTGHSMQNLLSSLRMQKLVPEQVELGPPELGNTESELLDH